MPLDWFNASPSFFYVRGINWKPYNLFVRWRSSKGGSWMGAGLLQIRGRHLFYVGRMRDGAEDPVRYVACVGFVWLTERA